jgi:hypothetical protein
MLPTTARVAYVVPTFTLTPYSNFGHSFYAFYMKYAHASGRIATDLGLLSTRVSANWSAPAINDERPLYDFLSSGTASKCGLTVGQNVRLTDDAGVDGGALFAGGSRQFDVVILGHEEYVTRAEYAQLKQFVAAGGKLVAMAGNTFWGRVNYSRATGMETFVIGHGFGYNGAYAWRTSYEPFDGESAGWFGSSFQEGVYGLRGAVIQTSGETGKAMAKMNHGTMAFTDYSYPHDEVNYLRNLTNTEVLAKFFLYSWPQGGQRYFEMPPVPVDAYVHWYGKGEVFCFGVFGPNIIMRDRVAQFFLIYAVEAGFGSAPQGLS